MSEMSPFRITIHCSDTENGKRCPAETIKKWHLERGFADIGYHMVIQPDGELEWGRPLNIQGAHVKAHNEGNVGICLIGRDKFSIHQFDKLKYQLDTLFFMYDIPRWEVYTHNYFDRKKTCPNMPINNLLAWVLNEDLKAVMSYLL